MFDLSSFRSLVKRPALLAVSCLSVISCGTTLTLDEPVPAIIDVNRNSTLAIIADNSVGRDIAREVRIKLHPSGFYRIQPLLHSPDPDTDVLVALSGSYLDCTINYDTSHDHDHDHDHDKKHNRDRYDYDRRICSYDVRGGTTCRISSRCTGSSAYRNYYGSDTSYNSEYAAHDEVIDEISDKIVRDLVPHQSTYTVTIDSDDENPILEQAAEACKAGNWTLGEQLAKQASANKPQSAEPWFLLGIIERSRRNFTRSSELIAKAASLQPSGKYQRELRRNSEIQINMQAVKHQLQTL